MSIHTLSLTFALAAQSPTVTPVTEGPAVASAASPDGALARPRGFVASAALGVNFLPVYPIPSGELSLFLGGALPITPRRPGNWVALGYRGSLSLGAADLFLSTRFMFTHRHHVAVQGAAGRRGRLFYGASFGLAVLTGLPSRARDPGGRSDFGLDGDVRLGAIVGRRAAQFIVGVQVRVSGPLPREDLWIPVLPNVGAFFGFNFGPDLRPGRMAPR